MSHKMATFTTTVVKTSNPTKISMFNIDENPNYLTRDQVEHTEFQTTGFPDFVHHPEL
jgi:hypothetical protein